jgi:boron transporter
MSGTFLGVLNLIPQVVLAGLFFVMVCKLWKETGSQLRCSSWRVTKRSLLVQRIQRHPVIWLFVAIQLIGFGATFAITQTIAAVGIPIIILLLIPIRTYLLPRWFTDEELSLLNAPTASSFTMISVCGNFGQSMGELENVATGEQTAVPSGSAFVNEGLFVQEESDSEDDRAERGEGPRLGMRRRSSRKSETRSEALEGADKIVAKSNMRRHSMNWQQRRQDSLYGSHFLRIFQSH